MQSVESVDLSEITYHDMLKGDVYAVCQTSCVSAFHGLFHLDHMETTMETFVDIIWDFSR